MHDKYNIDTLKQYRGSKVLDTNGDEIGTLTDIWLDQDNNPTWLSIRTGFWGTKSSFAPLQNATIHDDHIQVNYDKQTVKDAASIDEDGDLNDDEADRLFQHYNLTSVDTRSSTNITDMESVDEINMEVHDHASNTDAVSTREANFSDRNHKTMRTDNTLILSEEQLEAQKVQHERGKARIRKYIVEEEQTITVPVKREEIEVIREPIGGEDDYTEEDMDLHEDSAEMILNEETIELRKKIVPREKVRMQKKTITEDKTVHGTVRKEHLDVNDKFETDTK